jgi:hypothetical protein
MLKSAIGLLRLAAQPTDGWPDLLSNGFGTDISLLGSGHCDKVARGRDPLPVLSATTWEQSARALS